MTGLWVGKEGYTVSQIRGHPPDNPPFTQSPRLPMSLTISGQSGCAFGGHQTYTPGQPARTPLRRAAPKRFWARSTTGGRRSS